MFPPIAELAQSLREGRTTSAALVDQALGAAADPQGEGARVFIASFADSARAEAAASDALRAHGIVASPLAGIPISVKDLFDLAGQVTRAGSVVREDAAPADCDAPAIARLRAAGAVIVGRTNMTEFAYSGVGLNPHFGTPRNPYDRATGRIPGGSSSGAAVSVADGMAAGAIGTDTGGSVRIPAALCGLAGFKPTQRRVPIAGAFPLSMSLDSIGPLARTLACCAVLDQVMAGAPVRSLEPIPVAGLRLAVAQSVVLDGLDETVSARFEATLSRLSAAGARLSDIALPELAEILEVNAKGGFAAAEAYAVHRDLMQRAGARYDPRVGARIANGSKQSAADYVDLLGRRADICARADAATRPFDAVLMPTTARIAPPVTALEADDAVYHENNFMMLRNPLLGNFLDRCACTLPCHEPGEAPVGLMVMGPTMGDEHTLSVAAGIEAVLAG